MAKKPELPKTEKVKPTHEGLKSQYLELNNFKNIDKKIIDIGGHSIIIMGKNGTGKSTLIQAMKSPMDSKIIPSEPIKKGEESAKIIHRIAGNLQGEYKEYEMTLYFTPGNKSGKLTITNEKGETVKSPATMIKTIIGNVSFDITGWMNDKKDKKLQILKHLTGCGNDIDLCNIEIKDLKAQRKLKNDRATELEGALNNHGMTQSEIALYSNPVDMTALNTEMSSVAEAQASWDAINNKIEGFYKDIPLSQNNITRANSEIARIGHEILRLQNLMADQQNVINSEKTTIDRLEQNCKLGEDWKAANLRPVITDITTRIQDATSHNEKYLRIGTLSTQQQEMIKLKQEVDGYKMTIEAQENKRNNLITKSQLPVPGLSFDDEEIYLDGVPFEDGQQNTARIFDVSVEVAMALNPNLKIIFLDDASLYDKNHLNSIVKKIEERGYMAICEVVSENDEVEVFFTEEAI